MKTVFKAKTNESLPGIPSRLLLETCNSNPEGKALASRDKKQNVFGGGIWYPVKESWGHKDAIIVFVEA